MCSKFKEIPIIFNYQLDTNTNHFYLQKKHLKRFKPEQKNHSNTGIAKICSDQVLINYNWKGVKNKLPLSDLYLFKIVCYGK